MAGEASLHESGLLGLYWPARQEALDVCGRRAYESLRALQALGYRDYYFPGRSRRDALRRRLEVTEASVLAALAKGVSRTDIPRKPIPELGWHLSLWSGGADDESYSLNIRCGGYSAYVGNSVVMTLPPAAAPFSIAAAPDRARQAYEALLAIWEPAQAVLCQGSIEWEAGRLVPVREPLAQHPPRATYGRG